MIDPLLQVGLLGKEGVKVGVGLAHRRAHLVEPVHQSLGVGDAVGHVSGDVLGRVKLRLLRKEPDREPGRQPGLTGEPVVETRHDPQQRRFA